MAFLQLCAVASAYAPSHPPRLTIARKLYLGCLETVKAALTRRWVAGLFNSFGATGPWNEFLLFFWWQAHQFRLHTSKTWLMSKHTHKKISLVWECKQFVPFSILLRQKFLPCFEFMANHLSEHYSQVCFCQIERFVRKLCPEICFV